VTGWLGIQREGGAPDAMFPSKNHAIAIGERPQNVYLHVVEKLTF
jgi:hypothetical protein